MFKILVLFFFLIFSEIILNLIVSKLRRFYDKSYLWQKKQIITNIITRELDLIPKYSKNEYLAYKFFFQDKELGSTNRENIKNIAIYYKNKKKIVSHYSIGKKGERQNRLKYESNLFSSYGDSLCFCRFVNDNQTWQYFLSKKIKKKINNYGVGNYGLDQAYLRFKRNYQNKIDRPKNVIFLFGPETLRRNLSLWKHYYEFGNYFYTKPAFIFNKNKKKFFLNKNSINKMKENIDFKKIINSTKKKDIFYSLKFKKYLWEFPYLLSLLKNPIRKSSLLLFFGYKLIKKKYKFRIQLFERLKIYQDLNNLGGLYFDFKDKVEMYKNKNYINSTVHIMNRIKYFCKKNNIKYHMFIVPSFYDLQYYKKNKKIKKYYESLLLNAQKKNLKLYDLTNELIKFDSEKISADETYGGHLNEYGNKIISNLIFNLIYNEKKN